MSRRRKSRVTQREFKRQNMLVMPTMPLIAATFNMHRDGLISHRDEIVKLMGKFDNLESFTFNEELEQAMKDIKLLMEKHNG